MCQWLPSNAKCKLAGQILQSPFPFATYTFLSKRKKSHTSKPPTQPRTPSEENRLWLVRLLWGIYFLSDTTAKWRDQSRARSSGNTNLTGGFSTPIRADTRGMWLLHLSREARNGPWVSWFHGPITPPSDPKWTFLIFHFRGSKFMKNLFCPRKIGLKTDICFGMLLCWTWSWGPCPCLSVPKSSSEGQMLL